MKTRLAVGVFAVTILLLLNAPAQKQQNAAHSLSWDRESFSIDGKPLILFGGSMHYFRVPPQEWEPTMRRMHEDGFNEVDTIIPWTLHETEEGKFDFSLLERFLDLAGKYHLYVVARPGPYICGEVDQGGFPRWLSGKGVGFRTDSELSRKWTKHWYDAVMPVLARHQISRGGSVIMVQLENEYGHPQYISDEEKKDHLRFLWKTASSYGFDIPLIGNDIQFAQGTDDPILSRIYGTVDAYFGSYKELQKMLEEQRKFNPEMPVGSAEYGLADPMATVRTMLGLEAGYFDLYMFRGGSQFNHAAKGYEQSSYIVSAPIEEGSYASGTYRALKTTAYFLRQFGAELAPSKPAEAQPTSDDPEVWVRQRNWKNQGFLFVRSDTRHVSERGLHLTSLSQQHISYHDPRSGHERTIPQYTTMLLRGHHSRLIPLNLPVRGDTTLIYATSDLLGRYSYANRTWLVFYGDTGDEGEAAFLFSSKPQNPDVVWKSEDREAVYRMQFGRRDQVVNLTSDLSLLILSRDRAYRAREFLVGSETDLLVSDADGIEAESTAARTRLQLETQQPLGRVTLLSSRKLVEVESRGGKIAVVPDSGAQYFDLGMAAGQLTLLPQEIAARASWEGVEPVQTAQITSLVSLPSLGIWKKGITHYQASFPGRDLPFRLGFFTDDFKAVYINGKYVEEASNHATTALIGSKYCAGQKTCNLEIYYWDTARPKEDLSLWRMDEKKGLRSAEWVSGDASTPVETDWKLEFVTLDGFHRPQPARMGLNQVQLRQYAFAMPATPKDERAVWRLHLPPVEGLVYVNGRFLEHHMPGEVPVDPGDRPGIYLPPSLLGEQNSLLFVTMNSASSAIPLPVLRADADTIRKVHTIELDFGPEP